jgi:hypothetical protein
MFEGSLSAPSLPEVFDHFKMSFDPRLESKNDPLAMLLGQK